MGSWAPGPPGKTVSRASGMPGIGTPEAPRKPVRSWWHGGVRVLAVRDKKGNTGRKKEEGEGKGNHVVTETNVSLSAM
jgi:hypothetical protein